jgi:hypothetical protein
MALKLLGSLESSGGNVGIGTSSPSKTLHVYSGTDNEGIFMEGTGNGHWFNFKSGTSNLWSMGAQAGLMGWYNRTDSTYKMVIADAGNVGIGTTSPGSAFKLDVNGYIKANSRIYVRDSTKTLEFGTDYIQSYVTSGTGVNPIRFFTGTTEKTRIDGNGNVGIGTTAPLEKLHVVGKINSSNNIVSNSTYTMFTGRSSRTVDDYGGLNKEYFKANLVTAGPNTTGEASAHGFADLRFQLANSAGNTGMSDIMTLRAGGNVGIGTTSPRAKLEVSGDIYQSWADAWNFIGQVYQDGSQYRNGIATNSASRTTQIEARSAGTDGEITFLIGTGEVARMLHGGNVGIGTTSPSEKLQVSGNVSASTFITPAVHSKSKIRLHATGNDAHSIGTAAYANTYGPGTWDSGTIMHQFYGSTGNIIAQLGVGGSTSSANTSYFTGNVGIGTTSPNTPLTIETNTSDVLGALKIKNAGAGDASMFFTVNASGAVWQLGIDNSDGDKFKIGQDTQNADVGVGTKLTIDSSGKVGIGTTSPDVKLEVAGTIKANFQTNTTGTSGSTFLNLHNNVGGDISQQQTFIDFSFSDSNANFTPQVRIGAQVGRDADANAISKEGAGAFVVYTGDGTDELGAGTLTESFRVSYNGDGSFDGDVTANNLSGTNTGDQTLPTLSSLGAAPLASPALTGTPTAPTAGATVNTTQLATTAFVQTAIANLSDSAPATLNTLNELAAALGDDASFSTTVTNSIAAKLPLAGGTMTGNLAFNTGYTLSVDTTITDEIRIGDRVTLTESTDRADLLYINSGTSGWGGLQVGNTSNEFIFSLMGNGSQGGIYDDQNDDWWIVWNENAGVQLKYNNTARLETTNTGVSVTGDIAATGNITASGTGSIGGKRSYTKTYGSLNTTGEDVAGLVAGGNGNSALFTFTCHGHSGGYQKIVYSCYNTSATTWNVKKVIDEGTNDFDVIVSDAAATRTFTFVSRSGTKSYSPMVHVEHVGHGFDSTHR